MKKVIVLNKKEGETPLESLGVFCRKYPKYQSVSMTYAGRLDPMASGLLLVLAGEECKNKDKYLKFDKEYEFEVLFGFSTDTYDILGKVVDLNESVLDKNSLLKEIHNNIKFFIGKFKQKYPLYSSKTVDGKQLWQYARDGENIETPDREVNVKSLKYLNIKKVSSNILLKDIEKRIKKVKGDFRQKEILSIWQKNLKNKKESYYIAKFKIKCSSGTYVRGIANSLGEKMGVPALAYKIKRTKIGKYANL